MEEEKVMSNEKVKETEKVKEAGISLWLTSLRLTKGVMQRGRWRSGV